MGQLRRYFPADLLQLSPPTHEKNHYHAFTLLLRMMMNLITNKNTIITKQLLDPSLLTPKKRMAEARTFSGQCGREMFIVLESV